MPNERPRNSLPAALSPASFAIVMATGILGLDAGQQGHGTLSLLLLAFNAVAWPVIAALTIARALRCRQALLDDLRSHQRAPGFFTAVAGTAVLGSQLIDQGLGGPLVPVLAGLSCVLWLLLTYAVFVTLTVQPDKPVLADGINGGWLLAVVATQSIALIASLVAAQMPPTANLALNFAALAFWLAGGMLYVWIITLVFYRYLFLRFAPHDFTPSGWINMGAMAISTLAGALLVLNAPGAPFLLDLLPFLKGGTVLFWAVGTWWIPMLVTLEFWRLVRHRYPLRYDVAYWAAVFPLGMYSAATHQMSLALGLRFLAPLARGFFYIGLAAWVLAVVGLARTWRRPRALSVGSR